MTDHTCNGGCPRCVPELSADYWRQRAHKAEETARQLHNENERLQTQLARFYS
jgi:hypothetical protein